MGYAVSVLLTVSLGALAVALIFIGTWKQLRTALDAFGAQFKDQIDVTNLRIDAKQLGITLLALGCAVWSVLLLITRATWWLGIIELAITTTAIALGTKLFIHLAVKRTISRFSDQLEGSLRSLTGAVRVGLGLRQAFIHLSERAPEPSKREFTRVIGATNLGIDLAEALDGLARRIPTPETVMLARVIRVQTQTGGDLGGILEGLADTIRDRRRFGRKVSALTAQGRASAWVVGLLPVLVFVAVCVTQPEMRSASFDTIYGREFLAVGFGLDGLAALVLTQLARIEG